MTIRVSVVVPTHHRPALLARCLEALLAQDLCGDEYEVIVADDARSDETRRQVEKLAERVDVGGPALRYVRATSNRGPAAVRNAGWRAATGTVIAFTDDDCVPEPTWLRAGLDALSTGAAGAAGRVVVPVPVNPTDYEANAGHLAGARFVTANCFCRWDALQAVGGFDERFRIAWREDVDLQFTLHERGYQLIDAPEAVVVHPIRPAHWGVSLWQQHKSMYNALLYRKHPAKYRAVIQAWPPFHYYAIVLSALCTLASLLLRRKVPLAPTALWLVLTVRFCRRRLRGTSHAPAHVAEMIVTSLLIPWLSVYWRLRGAVTFRVWFL